MTELPTGWKLAQLNDLQSDEPRAITDGPFGSNLTRAHYTASGPRVVRLQNIGDGVFNDARAHISEAHFESLQTHAVLPGDLLVASLGEVLPRACIAPAYLGDAIVKADCIRVRLSPDVDPRWVMYSMQRSQVRRWADDHRHGVGRPRLGLKVIRQIPVPLPPLEEQRRIVDILEEHLSRLAEAEMLLEQNRRRLAIWCRAVLDSAFWHSDLIDEPERDQLVENLVRSRESRWSQSPSSKQNKAPVVADLDMFNGPLPWPVVSLESATEPRRTIRYGILMPRIDNGGEVRYLEVRDLTGNTLADKTFRLTSRQLDEQYSGSRLVGGDVVIAVRGSYERTAVVPEDLDGANLSRDVVRLAPLPELLPGLLHLWLQTTSSKAYLNRHARGVAVKGVNISTLRAMPVPLLPLEMQRRIVGAVNAQLGAGDRVTLEIDRATRHSATLRRALLGAAFSGRLTGRTTDIEMVEEMAGV